MTTDTTALFVSILIMVLIAVWVPFLDTCAGCVERRRQRRIAADRSSFDRISATGSELDPTI